MNAVRITCLLLLSVLAGCSPKQDQVPAEPRAAMTVTTATVQSHALDRVVEVQGPIAPWQEAIISARVGGLTLVAVEADVGDRVRKGQVIARFDTRMVNAELAQAKANLAQAAANAVQANANRDRTLRMQGRGAVSEQDQQLAQTQAEMAEAQRQMAEAQLTAQQIRLQDCEVRAVDDGVISARVATLGQVAQPGTELFRLIRQQRLEWRVELNAQQMGRVRSGQAVSLDLPDGSRVKGSVRQLAPSLDSTSRLGFAYVDLAQDSAARAGMFVSGRIHLAQGESLMIPAEAVVLRDGRSAVFLVGEDDRASRVAVETGRRQGNLIEILQGLQAGERVAVRGAGFLADGDRVKRVENAAPIAQAQQGDAAGATP